MNLANNVITRELTPEQKYVVLDVLSKFQSVSALVKKSFGAFDANKKPSSLEKRDLMNPADSISAALKSIMPSITAKINRLISQPQFEARHAEFCDSLSSAAKIMNELQQYYEYISKHNGSMPKETLFGRAKNLIGVGKNIKTLSAYNDKSILEPFEEVEGKLYYTLGKIEKRE